LWISRRHPFVLDPDPTVAQIDARRRLDRDSYKTRLQLNLLFLSISPLFAPGLLRHQRSLNAFETLDARKPLIVQPQLAGAAFLPSFKSLSFLLFFPR